MPRGGRRAGAGRPPGRPKTPRGGKRLERAAERQTAAIAAGAADAIPADLGGKTPLEYMLSVMNDKDVEARRRDYMAVAAAPFVHAKAGDKGKKLTADERAKDMAKPGGRFALPAPPTRVN